MQGLWRRSLEIVGRGTKSPTIQNTAWLGSSSALNGIIGAIIAGILARHLGVAEYGIYTLVISLLVLLTDVADLGVSSSIVRFGSESIAEGNNQKLKAVIAIVTRWKVIIGGSVLLIALLFLDAIVESVFKHVDAQISWYFRLSLIGCAIGISAGVFTPIYQSFKQFRTYSLLLLSRSLIKLLLVLLAVFVVAYCSVPLLIWIEIASLLVFLLLMYSFSPFKALSVTMRDRGLERQMFSFNKWISLYQVVTLVGARLDLAFVGGLSDAHALGLYGAASKISGFMNAVAGSYMSVLLTEMSSSVSLEILQRKQRRAFAVVAMIVGGVILMGLIAGPVVRLLFGQAFVEAASVLRILCMGLVFTVLAYPLNTTLFAMNKSAAFPLISIIGLLVFVAGNFYLIPLFGVEGAAMAVALSALAGLLVSGGYYLSASASLKHT
jgi:O-antigen/teichoic acid export membrane protein